MQSNRAEATETDQKTLAAAGPESTPVQTGRSGAYLLFMLVLSVLALGALAVQAALPISRGASRILELADTAFCLLFFLDFLLLLYRTENRRRYFFTWGWLDLLSSIPAVDALRWGRAARIMRIIRVLRGVRSARVLSQFILERRSQSAVLAAALVTITLVSAASISVLHFEAGSAGNIKSAEDAVWWSIATITTVGYGDKFPVTTEGRIVAIMLMVAGVGLFGTFSGLLAAWFLAPTNHERETELAELRREIRELKDLLRTHSRDGLD
jgi:voltage-gated potassium channel